MAASILSSKWSCVLLAFLLCVVRTYGDIKYEGSGCSAVKQAYAAKGFDRHDVPGRKQPNHGLSICPGDQSCCTSPMETNLALQSRQEFEKSLSDKILLLRTTFISRTAKFDAFFTALLDNSKKDLHDMFVRTYGLLYQQNSEIFSALYDDLRSYYKGSDINLLDALDGFFIELLQRMFELLNTQYEFDAGYLECVTESMDDLKPFGEVPQKLSIQVRRAFIAARTFVQGLAIGRDVIIEVSKLPQSASCSSALMKLTYCPYCSGLPYVKPCNNYCMNVMKGCLAQQADLNKPWNEYIDELMKVAERLEGPFNIEAVVDPIDVKISDAIMNFQEASETVKTKVFEGCGTPRLGRNKRDAAAAAAASSYDEYAYGWKYEQKQYVRPTTAAGTSLDRLVRDIKQKVEVAKDFWKQLPHQLCNDIAAPMIDQSNCWNGQTVNRYQPDVVRDGVMAQGNNPEVEVNNHQAFQQQILQLKTITNKLTNAYNGLDVDWIDTDNNDEIDSSGSGYDISGSGSGGNGNDEISFQPPYSTRDGPSINTRRPPKSKPEDDEPLYGPSSATALHSSKYLAALFSLLVAVAVRFTSSSAH